jgi:hypothetical protein
MKNYVILVALVLGLFGAVAPACGEVMIGDNVTFVTFDEEGKSVLDTGTVWNVSEDGEWLLIYLPPNYMTVISRWFVYSDENAANQLLTNLLKSSETYEPTEPAATDAFGETKGNLPWRNLENRQAMAITPENDALPGMTGQQLMVNQPGQALFENPRAAIPINLP